MPRGKPLVFSCPKCKDKGRAETLPGTARVSRKGVRFTGYYCPICRHHGESNHPSLVAHATAPEPKKTKAQRRREHVLAVLGSKVTVYRARGRRRCVYRELNPLGREKGAAIILGPPRTIRALVEEGVAEFVRFDGDWDRLVLAKPKAATGAKPS